MPKATTTPAELTTIPPYTLCSSSQKNKWEGGMGLAVTQVLRMACSIFTLKSAGSDRSLRLLHSQRLFPWLVAQPLDVTVSLST